MRSAVLACLPLLLAAGPRPVLAEPPGPKQAAVKPADRPARTYPLAGSPSEAVLDYGAILALARQVDTDLRTDLAACDPSDKAALTSLHTTLYATALLRKDAAAAGQHLARVKELREDPTARLMTGLLTGPLILALQAPAAELHATYRAQMAWRLADLPFKEVQGVLDRLHKGQKAASREQILQGLRLGVDPLVKEGKLSQEAAGALLGAALNLHLLLPLREDAVACLEALFEVHKADRAAAALPPTPLGTTRLTAKGPYFGQPLPGETPVPFAPEVLKAISPWASGVTFSPDGTECFLHVGDANYGRASMYTAKCVDGTWGPLEAPPFLAGFSSSAEPSFSQDGRSLVFTGSQGRQSTDLWTVSRTATGWGTPVALPAPLNSDLNEFRGSRTLDGTFYFGSERDAPGINQVYKARKNAAGAWAVERLGAPVNALSYDGDPCVAPDGRFLITYAGRPQGYGRVDLYVSFSDGKGGWGRLINLGPQFNSPDDDFGAFLSADGKFLFFNRHTAEGDKLFWVAVSAIDKLRP
jgi:hypothetical protein